MSSLAERGDPISSTFISLRRWMPLVMKAHQPLGRFVDLSCCARIDVAVTNADSPPGTASLELILLNSTLGRSASQSLGEIAIPMGSPETILRFNVPQRANIDQFDVIDVVFDLEESRRDTSAKVAINRFNLVPRVR